MVDYRPLNLLNPFDTLGQFDIIYCRNVLIYFDAPSRQRVIARLLRHIVPGGYLFLGHAESLMGMSHRVRSLRPAVYEVQPEVAAA
jgi:chemotaxis protein methyltransferase CheR